MPKENHYKLLELLLTKKFLAKFTHPIPCFYDCSAAGISTFLR